MKMTFQPKKRQRAKVHGFRARMRQRRWKKSSGCKKSKRKSKIICLMNQGRNFDCGLCLLNMKKFNSIKKTVIFRRFTGQEDHSLTSFW